MSCLNISNTHQALVSKLSTFMNTGKKIPSIQYNQFASSFGYRTKNVEKACEAVFFMDSNCSKILCSQSVHQVLFKVPSVMFFLFFDKHLLHEQIFGLKQRIKVAFSAAHAEQKAPL